MIPSTAPKPAPAIELGLRFALAHAGPNWGGKTGRGRPSREETERGEYLVANHGYRIKGMTVSNPTPAVAGKVEEPKVERVKVQTGIAELIPQMRGDDVVPYVNGKPWKLGIRGTCNNCNVSLTHCPCATPIVWIDYQTQGPVQFKAVASSSK
jgi:hypothetical protein